MAARFRFLIRDRAGPFTGASDTVPAGAGIEVVTIPRPNPSANAHAGRWVRTARTEVTGPMLIAGLRHRHAVPGQDAAHDHEHRPHRAPTLRPPGADQIAPAVITDVATPKYGIAGSWAGRSTNRAGGMKITG